jgi:pyruvate formate lyase activating enzyme
MPGSSIYSITTTGCNRLCKYCQNYDISQRRKIEGSEMTPKQVVESAIKYGAAGIAYTYNEPSILLNLQKTVEWRPIEKACSIYLSQMGTTHLNL